VVCNRCLANQESIMKIMPAVLPNAITNTSIAFREQKERSPAELFYCFVFCMYTIIDAQHPTWKI